MVNDQEIKGGHAPATKVGGARRRTRSKGDMAGATEAEPVQDEVTAEVSGEEVPVEEKELIAAEPDCVAAYKDNTPNAVKSFHEKPMPTKNIQISNNPQVTSNKMQIQQPRK